MLVQNKPALIWIFRVRPLPGPPPPSPREEDLLPPKVAGSIPRWGRSAAVALFRSFPFQSFDDLIFRIVLEINGFYVFHHCFDGSGLKFKI